MFDELRLLATSDKKSVVPSWLREDNQTLVSDREEERSWRDGAAHRIRGAVAEWLDDTLLRKEIILVSCIGPCATNDTCLISFQGTKTFGSIRSIII